METRRPSAGTDTADNKEWEVSAAQMRRTHGFSTPADTHRLNRQAQEAEALSREILKLSRDTLLIDLRFMEAAFIRFVLNQATVTADMATDGHFLYYNAVYICERYRQGRAVAARDYLHVVLHCLFRHLFTGKNVDKDLWDLSCDIAVENTISGLNLPALDCERGAKQRWLLDKLKADMDAVTAERVYHWFLAQDMPPEEYRRLRTDFYADDHRLWHGAAETSRGNGQGQGHEQAEAEGDSTDLMNEAEGQSGTTPPEDGEALESVDASGGADTGETGDAGDGRKKPGQGGGEEKDEPGLTPEATRQMWEDIARRVEVDLETFSNTWGNGAGGMQQALAAVNRERYDYGVFLRRFAVLGENIEINDDEFDAIFYTYGLSLYENMPLIEPLEYKEVKRVRDFAIVLDTSESVAGKLVQQFVTKTWNILKQTDNFFSRVNVHIIQCGARVEEDVTITSQEEFDAYMKRMVLRGFGGTDFRPAFAHVNELIAQHAFSAFRGMIYFTDGYGTFPAMPPAYDAAFVFVDQGREVPEVPVWAMRLVLTEEEIANVGSERKHF